MVQLMEHQSAPVSQWEKINILLVDDRVEGLVALEAVLSSPDWRLSKAASGMEALSFLDQEDFALVLLDVQMPGMDGFKTAELIRRQKRFESIPILFITAINKEDSQIQHGYSVGAVDYIFKPYDPFILKSKVSVFADLYRKNKLLKEQARLEIEQQKLAHERDLVAQELASLRRYQSLANAVPHMIWRALPEGSAHEFNRAWHEMTGLSPEESWGSGWQSALLAEDLKQLRDSWDQVRTQPKSFERECRLRRKNEEIYRWYLVRFVPEKDGQNRFMGWISTWTDIHERKQAEESISKMNSELEKRVEEATAELKKLHAAFTRETFQRLHVQQEMLSISEREQKRMGQDLHDGIAQQLAGLAFLAKSLYQRMDRKGLAEAPEVLELMDTAKKILEQTRSLSRSFYPLELEKLGLRGALKDLSNNSEKIFQIQCALLISPDAEAPDPFIATHLYRISQEAVHNAIKHGKARRIEIGLHRMGEDGILQIKDNGVGFLELDKAKPGCMGLKIMEYRAQMIGGFLSIEQRQGEGTLISVKWKIA